MWSCVCPIHNVTACKLMEERAIKGLPSHYNICLSQLKYQMKNFWLKASVLYGQLLSSAPYAALCLCSLHTEQFINYFGQKLTFFFKFNKFQPLNFF